MQTLFVLFLAVSKDSLVSWKEKFVLLFLVCGDLTFLSVCGFTCFLALCEDSSCLLVVSVDSAYLLEVCVDS